MPYCICYQLFINFQLVMVKLVIHLKCAVHVAGKP